MWPANPTLSSERGGNSRPWGIPPSEPYPPTSSGRSHFLGHLFGFCFPPPPPPFVPFSQGRFHFPLLVSPTPCQPHSLSALDSCPLLHLGSPVGGCACLGWGGKGLPSPWEPVVAFRRSKSPATLRPLLPHPTQGSGLSPCVRERKTPASGYEDHDMTHRK